MTVYSAGVGATVDESKAHSPVRDSATVLNAADRARIVNGALRLLQSAYVFPQVAAKMDETIRDQLAKGAYDSAVEPSTFAYLLTRDLQQVSGDKHIHVFYSKSPRSDPGTRPDEPGPQARLESERKMNFGFQSLGVLPGNIGYLDLRMFSGLSEADDTAVAAMEVLANTDALIIDLRNNGGGSPHMIDLLASYLFDGVVHLNDFYLRQGDRTVQFFTAAEVRGRRYGVSKPVFILTSHRTFSGAEEFAYDLQVLKRATIVGETTGGGANPGSPRWINEHFRIWVPHGTAVNPVTKNNWEGTGVEPDVKVDAPQALEAAQAEALKRLKEKRQPGTTQK
ncbi:MAG TPA: S41 family peptidase [Opitutaceae bacterium]|nr:S41 family peptidase [Opitutaceae bacterium]